MERFDLEIYYLSEVFKGQKICSRSNGVLDRV